MDLKSNGHYCAYYCEENIWQLCQQPLFQKAPAFVAFISNPQKSCALWHQRAAHNPQAPMVWDYHVIMLVEDEVRGWLVWDLDTTLDCPVEAEIWFQRSFAIGHIIPKAFQPQFRLLTAEKYLHHFSSDRSHMRDENGTWLHPPPDWAAPFQSERGMNLFRFVQMKEDFIGEVLDLSSVRARFVVETGR